MLKILLVLLPLAGLHTPGHADNCGPIAEQIEAKMRTGGLAAPQVIAVDKAAAPGGRVVGSCASGSKQLVLVAGTGSASGADGSSGSGNHSSSASIATGPTAALRLRRVPADNIVTECKDGRVVRGPDCSRPAPRPKPAASSEPTADAAAPAAPAGPAASAP